jgi:hypothetical protein
MAEEHTSPQITFMRDEEDFISTYANHVLFQASVWDLKLVFGQLDQPQEHHPVIEQHTAITMPWMQVKLMAYYLLLNLLMYESENGDIKIPPRLLPPEPPPLDPEQEKDPHVKEAHESAKKMRAEFIASLKM